LKIVREAQAQAIPEIVNGVREYRNTIRVKSTDYLDQCKSGVDPKRENNISARQILLVMMMVVMIVRHDANFHTNAVQQECRKEILSIDFKLYTCAKLK
jgi:hypothetical protein